MEATPVSQQPILPKFRYAELVLHITDVEGKEPGMVTAFMVRKHNHSFQVVWSQVKSEWHMEEELRTKPEQEQKRLGFWPS